MESIGPWEFHVNVHIKPTLSVVCTHLERGQTGEKEQSGDSVEMMPNVVCNAVFLSVIGSI